MNKSQTSTYNTLDFIVFDAVKILSKFLGVNFISKPFWNRWKASMLDEQTIKDFLSGIDGISNWPESSSKMVNDLIIQYEKTNDSLLKADKIVFLKKITFLAHLAQWGCLSITATKKELYKISRDYYIKAANLDYGNKFERIEIIWHGKSLWGNLHLPNNYINVDSNKIPLIVIVHGMDDTKEEHFATVEAFQNQGLACFCIDGPGQGESLFLESIYWGYDFHEAISTAITQLCELYNFKENIGLLGISWGGMWVYKVAAINKRIKAIYDLGGPINSNSFNRLPFFIKTKFCQVLGVNNVDEVPDANNYFSIMSNDVLENVNCNVRIVHGAKDPMVEVKDKEWLKDRIATLNKSIEVSIVIHPDGDHCCTGQFAECRADANSFFKSNLEY